MITKKYYKILAELLGKAEDLEDFYNKLTEFLAQDNPKFDKTKFRMAIENTYSNKKLAQEED